MSREREPLTRVVITQAVAGDAELVAAPDASSQIKVVGFFLGLDAAGTFHFESGTTDLTGIIPLAANAPVGYRGTDEEPILECAVGEALHIETTGGAAEGVLSYYVEGVEA